jgi:hypothetical protein
MVKLFKNFSYEKYYRKHIYSRRGFTRTSLLIIVAISLIAIAGIKGNLFLSFKSGFHHDGDDDITLSVQNEITPEYDKWWMSTKVQVWNALSENARDGYRGLIDNVDMTWTIAPKGLWFMYDRGTYDKEHECIVIGGLGTYVSDINKVSSFYKNFNEYYDDAVENSFSDTWQIEHGMWDGWVYNAWAIPQDVESIPDHENNYFPQGGDSSKPYTVWVNDGYAMSGVEITKVEELLAANNGNNDFYLTMMTFTKIDTTDEATVYAVHRWMGSFSINVIRGENNEILLIELPLNRCYTDVVVYIQQNLVSVWEKLIEVFFIILDVSIKLLTLSFRWILARSAEAVTAALGFMGDLAKGIVRAANWFARPLELFGINLHFRTPKDMLDMAGWASTFAAGVFLAIIGFIIVTAGIPAAVPTLQGLGNLIGHINKQVLTRFGKSVG